jgi:hypothetical protein
VFSSAGIAKSEALAKEYKTMFIAYIGYISNHYEVFLLFLLQSLWNLGTKNSSGLTPPAYDSIVTALELTLSLSRLFWESVL